MTDFFHSCFAKFAKKINSQYGIIIEMPYCGEIKDYSYKVECNLIFPNQEKIKYLLIGGIWYNSNSKNTYAIGFIRNIPGNIYDETKIDIILSNCAVIKNENEGVQLLVRKFKNNKEIKTILNLYKQINDLKEENQRLKVMCEYHPDNQNKIDELRDHFMEAAKSSTNSQLYT